MKNSMHFIVLLTACFAVSGALCAENPQPKQPAGASPPYELQLAADALKNGDEAEAWQLYEKNTQVFAENWTGLDGALVAWVPDQLRKQKRYKEALALCNDILTKQTKLAAEHTARIMLTRGDIFRDQENFAAARMEYQSVEKHNTYKTTEAGKLAKFRIVDILRATKDYAAAEEMLERLKDLPSLDTQAEAYYHDARIAFDRQAYDEVRENIEEVKKRVPEHIEALFLEAELNLREDILHDPELEIGARVLTTYLVPGRPVTMKMQDRNLAVARGGGGIPVEMTTSKGGDNELVILSPSPRDPALFRGTITTRMGDAATNNMYLEITGSDVVSYNLLESFQRDNDLNYEAKKMVVVSDGNLIATSGEFISTAERDQELLDKRIAQLLKTSESLSAYERQAMRNTAVVRPGNDIRIQVADLDRNLGPEQDKVFVDVETSSGDIVNGVALVETNAHAGIFRGDVATDIAPPKATASDSASGKKPGSVILARDEGGWSSVSDGKKPKWFEVDLMTAQPIKEAVLELAAAGNVTAASLWGGTRDKLIKLASTLPDDKEVYGYVDIAGRFGDLSRTAAYIYTEARGDIDADAVFKIGSCDGVVCWLNGVEVHKNLGGRMWKPEEDVVNVKLKQGINGILLKVTQLTGPWGASLTILDAAGNGIASLKGNPPVKPGVVTDWHIFDRPTPENIEISERITVTKPVKIGDETFRWIPTNVAPVASLAIADNMLRSAFYGDIGARRLRWSFDDYTGQAVAVKRATITNKFGDTVVPSDTEFEGATSNRRLELGPGDKILIKYVDERRTQGVGQTLTANMSSGFHNAEVSMEYETITAGARGGREIVYDKAIRFRPGTTDKVVVRVIDYDMDVSSSMDKVKVLIQTSGGRQLWLEALETHDHSGEFLAILRFDSATEQDSITAAADETVTVSYQDRENGDGILEKKASITGAPGNPPELCLYRSLIVMPEVEDGISEAKEPVLQRRPAATAQDSTPVGPVVSSIDTSLFFTVTYPEAALSLNSIFQAKIVTERELEAAKAAGREPEYVVVPMSLADPENAEFKAAVTLDTGIKQDYDEEDGYGGGTAGPAGAGSRRTARLHVRGDDIVRVVVRALGSDAAREGTYSLAADASLMFTDEKYTKPVKNVYVGDYLYLRLTDRDKDVTDDLDKVTVNIEGSTGKVELALMETLPHSARFTGRVKTEMADASVVVGDAPQEDTLRIKYGEMLKAFYIDERSAISSAPRKIRASVSVCDGADGALATFTKRFADPEIAVKTRLLTAEALLELAKGHRKSEQKDLADKEIAEGKMILEEAIADYPHTKHAPHAEFLLANLAQELERYTEAVVRYEKVLSNWPDSEFAPKAQLRKGICLEKIGDYEKALDTYVELTYSYPNSPLVPDAVIRLGQHFYRTEKFDVAATIFGNFQARSPEHELAAKSLFLAGQCYLKGAEDRKQKIGGEYDEKSMEWFMGAIGKFGKLIADYDDKELRSEAMYWRADCYLKVKDMLNAYQTLKKLTWDYPESKWAKFARGLLVQQADAFKQFEEE